MSNRSPRLSIPLSKVSLLLGVYALHIFLFLGLTAFSNPANANTGTVISSSTNHSRQSGTHRDPASVECRSLFKYDDSKQQLIIDHFPAVVLFNTNHCSYPSIISTSIPTFSTRQLSDASVKRHCLLGVFLI